MLCKPKIFKFNFQEAEIARANASTNKRVALQALKRKKNLEKQQEHLAEVFQTLDHQKTSLENAALNAQVLDVLATTSKTLKHGNNKLDVDKVHDVMEDISEQYDIGKEIAGAISNPLRGDDFDEDDLMAVLNDLTDLSFPLFCRGICIILVKYLSGISCC